ncbi:MAG: SctK family type III secretion system sorting platform protein [Pseudomonadota bacterium]
MSAEQGGVAIPTPRPLKARLRFERLPAAYCHPERIQRLLPDGLPAQFRDRLLASTRLRFRLSSILAERHALQACGPDMLATPAGRFAQLEGEVLQSALRRIGAIWHARTLRTFILAEPLRQLMDRLGRDNYQAALRSIDLAPETAPDETDDGDRSPDADRLVDLIERDGLIAVNAWCHQQPAALGARLKLKLRPCPEVDGEPPASLRELGPKIVDRVAMEIAHG